MGACLNTMTVDGKASKEEVLSKFNDRCEQDGYDSGHSYSGSFSQFQGLRFTDKVFDAADDAEEYVSDHGEKWGPAIAVRHKKYDAPKSVLNHDKARAKLQQKIWLAEGKLGNARRKAQMNNRTKVPSYVTKYEAALERIKESVQPKIDERTAKMAEGLAKAAAKSNEFVWLLGGWCSS